MLRLQVDLTVSFPALDSILEQDQCVQHLFWARGTSGNVYVNRDDLIRSRDG
jgi:hypothetical protein